MNEQYNLINEGLLLLKQSDIPLVEKLQIEIQLIKMKRLLLSDAMPSEVTRMVCGEESFEALLSQIRGICAGDCQQNSLNLLNDRIEDMLTSLGGHTISVASFLQKPIP
jgi:hypothetical protein